MLCDKCGKRPATTHIHANIGGEVREMNLCAYCASVMGYGSVFGGLGGLVGSLLEEQRVQEKKKEEKRCPCCGATFEEIAESGKMGCAACYETFAEQLAPSLHKMHGKTGHVGKTPAAPETPVPDPGTDRLAQLKKDLAAAVSAEEFERAAALRDQIKAMEEAEDRV